MSAFERLFDMHLKAHKIAGFERELVFHPERKWRFDFANTEHRIAVEIDGGIFGKKSGHNTGSGILRKMEKMNEAQRLGWRVFSFSTGQVSTGEAVNYLLEVLKENAA